MNVLVTGAGGYIGLFLAERLIAAGHKVVAYGHPPRGVVRDLDWTFVEGDILDIYRKLPKVPIDAVVHLAGGGGPVECVKDPVRTVRDNVMGTGVTAMTAQSLGATRLLFASTTYVYPSSTSLLKESDAEEPDTLYGAVKEAAELTWASFGGTSLRLAHVYGPGLVRLDSVMDRFTQAAVKGTPVTVRGDGSREIEYVHLSDVCSAFLLALIWDTLPPSIFNIGTGKTCSVKRLAEVFVEEGASHIEYSERGYLEEPNPPRRCMNNYEAKKVLGWAPKVQLLDGVRDYVRCARADLYET